MTDVQNYFTCGEICDSVFCIVGHLYYDTRFMLSCRKISFVVIFAIFLIPKLCMRRKITNTRYSGNLLVSQLHNPHRQHYHHWHRHHHHHCHHCHKIFAGRPLWHWCLESWQTDWVGHPLTTLCNGGGDEDDHDNHEDGEDDIVYCDMMTMMMRMMLLKMTDIVWPTSSRLYNGDGESQLLNIEYLKMNLWVLLVLCCDRYFDHNLWSNGYRSGPTRCSIGPTRYSSCPSRFRSGRMGTVVVQHV